MRNELTDKQIEFYRTNGFIVVEDFLDPDELEEWRRCTDEAVAERLGGAIDFRTNQMHPDTFYAQVFTQYLRLVDTHEGMRKLNLRSPNRTDGGNAGRCGGHPNLARSGAD